MQKLHSLLPLALLSTSVSFAQVTEVPTSPKEYFVEVPGELEFTGQMIARPIQPQEHGEFGLTLSDAAERRAAALEILSNYDVVETWPEVDWFILSISEGTENDIATRLMSTGNFEYVEPNWRVYPIACPNDPRLNQQWHHNANRMNSCNGWDLEVGDPNIVVAICDTGIRRNHEEFQQHRKEAYNAVDQVWENNGGSVNDINGHGTACTGCAAANGNNGVGIAGSGWDLGHRMLRVSNSSSGSSTITVLTHAARTAADVGDKVASVSYSGVQSSGVNTTGGYVRGKGALLVWAAGNSGQNMNGSRDDNVIVVGATTSSDTKSSFSNYGSFVDLMAPGSSVYTTLSNSNSSYGSVSGTSFSCPLTAGLCGLIYSADPSLTPTEVETILRNGCDDLGSSGVDNTYGYGRIDIFNSLSLVGGGGGPDLLFSDDFESGGLSSGGWSNSNNVRAKVAGGAAYTGAYGARLKKGGQGTGACLVGIASKQAWIESPAIDTTGYTSVEIRFAAEVINFEIPCEELTLQWYNGVNWQDVTSITVDSWNLFNVTMPSGAANNAAMKFRFITNAKGKFERANIDDVAVYGS